MKENQDDVKVGDLVELLSDTLHNSYVLDYNKLITFEPSEIW